MELNGCQYFLLLIKNIFTTNSRSERGSAMCRVHQVVRPW